MNEDAARHDSICLVQVTDTHLLADPQARLNGWRTQAALDAVLADLHHRYPHPDALLLSGDLVHDETAAGYRRLGGLARGLGAPVFAIPGNHDDPATMARAMTGVQVGGDAALGGWRLHLLDSRIAGSDGGRIGRAQLQALRKRLTAEPTLIAVHHPPAPVGSAWLDAMRLADGDALLRLAADSGVRAIVCGHVHQAFDAMAAGVRQLTTPATCRQFTPGSREPAEDADKVPGYRWLQLGADGRLRTRVHRVPAARVAGLGGDGG